MMMNFCLPTKFVDAASFQKLNFFIRIDIDHYFEIWLCVKVDVDYVDYLKWTWILWEKCQTLTILFFLDNQLQIYLKSVISIVILVNFRTPCRFPFAWTVLIRFGSLGMALNCFDLLWIALVCFGMLWFALDGFGLLWIVLNRFESFWIVLYRVELKPKVNFWLKPKKSCNSILEVSFNEADKKNRWKLDIFCGSPYLQYESHQKVVTKNKDCLYGVHLLIWLITWYERLIFAPIAINHFETSEAKVLPINSITLTFIFFFEYSQRKNIIKH